MKKVILSVLISMSMFAFGCSSGGDGSSSNNPPTLINPVNPDSTANNSFKISSVVTAGFFTVYAITEDGRLYAWGNNGDGLVGNGESGCSNSYDPFGYKKQPTPCEVKEVGKVKSVEVYGNGYIGGYTVYAITEDGRLYAWGHNEYGQVGNGTTTTQTTPYEVKEVGKVKSVVTDGSTVYAITEDGRLYAWGANVTTPYEVKEVGKVKSVVTGSTVYAITEDNRLYAWGYNYYGQVGNGESGFDEYGYGIVQTTPYEVKEVGKVKSVEIYGETVYAITEDGRLYAWGANVTTPYEVKEVGKVKSVVTDGSTVYAITEDGRLYAWGANVTTPYEVKEVGKVKSVEIYGSTVYAITEDNRLYSWGYNRYGLVGNGESGIDENGDGIVQTTPYEVKEVGKVKSVEVNNSTVYAITEDNRLYAWGDNPYGEVGNGYSGYNEFQPTPYEVTQVGKVKSVERYGSTVYAITEDGRLYTWGYNLYGQVGNGESGCSNSYNTSSCKKQTTPYEVTQVGKVKSVEVCYDNNVYATVYAITEDGRLYAWGWNLFGQVGNGSTRNDVTTPYEVVISKY